MGKTVRGLRKAGVQGGWLAKRDIWGGEGRGEDRHGGFVRMWLWLVAVAGVRIKPSFYLVISARRW